MADATTSIDAPMIRTVLLERNEDTQATLISDIREFAPPTAMDGRTRSSFTTVSKDAVRRALLVDLAHQIDDLMAGRIAEIQIVMS